MNTPGLRSITISWRAASSGCLAALVLTVHVNHHGHHDGGLGTSCHGLRRQVFLLRLFCRCVSTTTATTMDD